MIKDNTFLIQNKNCIPFTPSIAPPVLTAGFGCTQTRPLQCGLSRLEVKDVIGELDTTAVVGQVSGGFKEGSSPRVNTQMSNTLCKEKPNKVIMTDEDFAQLSRAQQTQYLLRLQREQQRLVTPVKRHRVRKEGLSTVKVPQQMQVVEPITPVKEDGVQLTISKIGPLRELEKRKTQPGDKPIEKVVRQYDVMSVIYAHWWSYQQTNQTPLMPKSAAVVSALQQDQRLRAQLPKLLQVDMKFKGYKQRACRMQTVNLFSFITEEPKEEHKLWLASLLFPMAKLSGSQLKALVINNIMYALIRGRVFNRSLVNGHLIDSGVPHAYSAADLVRALTSVGEVLVSMRKAHAQIKKCGVCREQDTRYKTSGAKRSSPYRDYPINDSAYSKLMVAFYGTTTTESGPRTRLGRVHRYTSWEEGIGEAAPFEPYQQPPEVEAQGLISWVIDRTVRQPIQVALDTAEVGSRRIVRSVLRETDQFLETQQERAINTTADLLDEADSFIDAQQERAVRAVSGMIPAMQSRILPLQECVEIAKQNIIERSKELSIDLGLSVSAAYLSKQLDVRLLCSIIAIRKIFGFFDLGCRFAEFIRVIATSFGQEGRDWLEQLQGAAMRSPPEEELGVHAQALPSMSMTFQKWLLEKGLNETYNYVKTLVTARAANVEWDDQLRKLRDVDKDLWLLAGGLKMITEHGGAVWVGMSSNNALIASRVGRLANRLWAKYNTIPPPIPMRALKAMVDMANGYASTITAINGGVRQAATVVYLYGLPGQGKTTSCTMLRASINDKLQVMPLSQSYSPTLNEEFHDGYVGQPIVMINDAFHMTDKNLRYQTSNMIMAAADTTPYPLKMSSVGAKGNVFFSSSVVLASSNTVLHETALQELGLSDPTALHRRIDFYVEQRCVRDDIMVTCGNHKVIAPSLITETMGSEIYGYTLRNVVDGSEIATLTHEQLVERILCTIDRKARMFDEARGLSVVEEERLDGTITQYVDTGAVDMAVSDSDREKHVLALFEHPAIEGWLDWGRSHRFATTAAILGVVGAIVVGAQLWQQHAKVQVGPESRDEQYVRKGPKVPVRLSRRSINRQMARREDLERELVDYVTNVFSPEVAEEVGDPEITFPQADGSLVADLTAPYVAQGCDDENALNVAGGKLMNQLYWAEFVDNTGRVLSGQAFNINSRFLLVPLHTWSAVKQDLNQVRLTGVRKFTLDASWVREISVHPECEIAVLELDRFVFPQGSDLTSKLVTEEQLSMVKGTCLLACRLGNSHATAGFFGSAVLQSVSSNGVAAVNGAIPGFKVTSLYKYPMMQTFKGMCASPVLVMDSRISGKIIGFHCAGDTVSHGGYCAPVTYEMFKHLSHHREAREAEYITTSPIAVGQGLEVLGGVTKRFYQSQNVQTTIVPSLIHGRLYPTHNAPARLKPDSEMNPLYDAVVKRCGDTGAKSGRVLHQCIQLATMHYRKLFKAHGKSWGRVLTVDESINGTGEPFVDPIVMKTSPGFPWNVYKPGSKVCWFRSDGDMEYRLGPTEELYGSVMAIVNDINRGETPEVVFRDSLKDEKRPIEKVQAGKTRLFCGAPVDFTVVFRQYYQVAIARICELSEWGPVSVGIDPHGRAWTSLVKQFDRLPGDNFMAGDFAGFDCHVPACYVMGALAILRNLTEMTEADMKVCDALDHSVAFSHHVVEGLIYRVVSGVPSGVPGTSVINSLANLLMHMEFWHECGYRLHEFFPNCEARFYGDDSVVKVHPQFYKFNMVEYNEACELTGWVSYTNSEKTDVNVPYVRLAQLEFLTRKFRKDSDLHVYCAPLPMKTILDSVNWVRSEDPELYEDLMCSTADSFAVELSHYPQPEYDQLTQRLADALVKIDFSWCPPIYRDQILRYL